MYLQTTPQPVSLHLYWSCPLAAGLACTVQQLSSLQSHWRIVFLSRISFVLSACNCCHSFSLSQLRGPPLNIITHNDYFLFILGALPSYSTLPNLIDAVTHFLFTLCLSLTQTHAHQHNLKIIYSWDFDHYS